MRLKYKGIILAGMCCVSSLPAQKIEEIQPDLVMPPVTDDTPAPGKRVKQVNEDYEGTEVHHLLYLPTDWKNGEKYPVIVEYAGNKYKTNPGTVEGSKLGYGITGGKGTIWICMPFVDKKNQKNADIWWGDIDATVEYCKQTVKRICADYGGDPERLFIAGFSRGAIACNYIGLHDDEIASLWRGFICHSHYDGVRKWDYVGSDRTSAAERLKRLGQRPQFISSENDINDTKSYLNNALPSGRFTFHKLSFTNHTDRWVLRDTSDREFIRNWYNAILQESINFECNLRQSEDKPDHR